MATAFRFLGAAVLGIWILSLLLWLYVAVRVVVGDCTAAQECNFDFLAPVINGVPFFNFLNTGLIAFALSVTCLFLYLAFWWRTD